MAETAYLKDELGAVLAKGLAATAIARPADPAEFLALWLLHHLQQQERRAAEVEAAKALEAEREEWAKGRAQREKAATATIQREWRAHVNALEAARQQEAELRDAFAAIEETLDERFPEEAAADAPDKGEAERDAEQARLTLQSQFGRARAFAGVLSKAHVADFKKIPATNADALMVLKCCFYAQGLRPRQLDSADKIRALIKPFPFTQWLATYDPVGTPLERKRPVTRVRRLLSKVDEEAVKRTSAALHAVFTFLYAAAKLRCARDDHLRARRAAGKDVEEELEDDDEPEDEEKDAAEEAVRAEELEALRVLEAQRAAEAAENEVAAADE